MAMSAPLQGPLELPKLPTDHTDFIAYLGQHPETPVPALLEPFKVYEGKLREIFAQQPQHEALKIPHINTAPIFEGHQDVLRVRARGLDDKSENEKYLMPLEHGDRKPQGAPAVVSSLQEFKKNFDLFSESSLVDLDWTNVVAAGSSVVTALLPVPEKYNGSKRAQREYYHQKLAPSSDVDLFIYGLDEEAAIQKMQQIESRIRDSILQETTTIRTKNAVTIASQYPIRHVQIVLRLYRSVSEILTGFDVDCSCVAYDGTQVYGAPRAIGAFVTQTNTVDLTRRSPSYEYRLSKYSRRGFEVYWPLLDRHRIDPTIFERSFARTLGLARLLVLERLPKPDDRENYLAQRRAERGRPAINTYYRNRHQLGGNLKDQDPGDVADWVYEDEASNYHSFTVPYGPKYHAKKIEKLLYTKDILLNAEWALKKDRKDIGLHRHPVFLGSMKDVLHDCCGNCPVPTTDEEIEIAAEESKIHVSGELEFMKDDPGRQAIGSFNPLTGDDWTEMAYVGNTTRLCQAIVDADVAFVQHWCEKEGSSIDRRDHTGRTPLHLATQCSSIEIVRCLIDHGARIVARLVDGTTALHIAAARGDTAMVKALLEKSEANEEEHLKNEEARKAALKQATRMDEDSQLQNAADGRHEDLDSDDDIEDAGTDESTSMTEGSFVKISSQAGESARGETMPEDNDGDPDVYDVDVLAWDTPVSPLHLAILYGHIEVIETLVNNFGADVLLPVKLLDSYSRSASGAILTLVLAGETAARTLLNLGASSAQADMKQISALHYNVAQRRIGVLKMMFELDGPAAKSALNHISVDGWRHSPDVDSPLSAAIRTADGELVDKILGLGAKPTIELEDYVRSWKYKFDDNSNRSTSENQRVQNDFKMNLQQPIVLAVDYDLPGVVQRLLTLGADVNTLDKVGHQVIQDSWQRSYHAGMSLLDVVTKKIKDLANSLKEADENAPAIILADDSHYLGSTLPGSYHHWGISKSLEVARSVIHDLQKNRELKRKQDLEQIGIKEKKDALSQLHQDFNALRSVLLKQGGKTFNELHPEIKAGPDRTDHVSAKPDQFDPSVTFQSLEGKRDGYLRLFQAVWEDDVATVKSLTLSNWGPSGENLPLQIAVRDSNDVSPFALAFYRGHASLAKIILEIAQMQYRPRDIAETRTRYAIDSDSDGESDEEDQLNIHSELLDENYTIDDIGALADTIKSKIPAMEMLCWSTQIWRFSDKPESEAKLDLCMTTKGQLAQSCRWESHLDPRSNFGRAWNERILLSGSLLHYAMAKESKELVEFLLQCGSDNALPEDHLNQKQFTIDARDWIFAVERGNPQILAELIKVTGAGMPLEYLAKQTGVEEDEKPKYYQGLKIHGKVRSDWAQESRGYDNHRQHTESRNPPLLESSFRGSIASVEWFLSNTPLRMYREFALNHEGDQRVKTLSKAPGGFEKAVSDWLGARSNLALHCAVMSRPQGKKSLELIKGILETLPRSIDVKSTGGYTPLSLAFSLRRLDIARALIAAGADQTTRDNSQKNLVHQVLGNIDDNARVLQDFIKLVDRRLLKAMFLERCTDGPGATTPLAYWLLSRQRANVEVLEVILEHSEGEDLLLMDRSGQLPLHQAIKAHSHQLAKVMIQSNPALLYRENAMGQTPSDLVESLYLHHRTDHPPRLTSSQYYRQAIQDREPRTFVGKTHDQTEDEHDIVKTWRVCKEAAAEFTGRRKLVSVMEANEVANRLAEKSEQERKQREMGDQEHRRDPSGRHEDDEEKGDEVSRWYHSAQGNPE